MEQKLAIFLADEFEEIEGLTVVDICRRAGLEIDMVSISESLTVTGSHKIEVKADKLLSQVDFTEYDMLVLPGGLGGTKRLGDCKALMKQVDDFVAKNKWIAAICAAPTIFGKRGLLQGKKAGCYPGMEDGLLGAKVSMDEVSVDGTIITSRGMGTSIAFALKIVEVFAGKETTESLGKKIVYKG